MSDDNYDPIEDSEANAAESLENSQESVDVETDDATEEQDAQEPELTPEQERDQFKEKYLRALADLENIRRRHAKDIQDLRRYASERPLMELLPVFDNLHRAVEHAGTNPETIVDGVKMVLSMAEQAFGRMGVVPIGEQGEKFDPNLHDALQQIVHDEIPNGHVATLFEKGYKLHDRLLRPAKVVVSKGPENQTETETVVESSDEPATDDLLARAQEELEGWEPGKEEE